MSSIYTKSSVGYLLHKLRNILAMVLQNVAGELVRPKNMTLGWNNPNGVLNAAFHRSLFLIRIFSYPQRMSNFVNSSFPCRWSRIVLMRGSGYSSRTVQEFSTR